MANIGDLEFTLTVKDNLAAQLEKSAQSLHKVDAKTGQLAGSMRDLEAGLNKLVSDYGKLSEAAQKAYNKGLDVKNFRNSAKEVEGILSQLQDMSSKPTLLSGDNAIKVFLANITKVRTGMQSVISASEKMLGSMRNISEMQSKLGVLQRSAEKVSGNGLALGVSTAGLDKAINDVKTLVSILGGVDASTLGVGKNLALADYGKLYNEVTRALREAVAAQKELNSVQTKANNQSAKDAAKAARDDAKAEKQRQQMIEQSLVRIQALQRALRELWSTRQQSRSLGIDTTRIDKEIQSTIDKIRQLQAISGGLQSGNLMYLGKMGSTGNGREVRAIREAVTAQKELNAATIASSKAQSDLVSKFQQVSNAATQTNGALADMKNYLGTFVGFDGFRRLVDSIINVGGQIEMQHIGLQTIIGDLQSANEIWGQMKGLALQSPFTFQELTKDVKQLAAYGIENDELYETTKRLADVASGVSVSFERIALAYGQTMARAKLDGKELRQFANAGIPILSELSKYYKETRGMDVTEGEVRKMTFAGDVSFDDVKAVFKKMTDEGGRFYNMQLVQSETLYGRMNKLKDAWEIMLSEFASKDNVIGGTFSHILDGLTTIVQKANELLPVIGALFTKRLLGGGASLLTNALGFTGKQVGANILATKGSLANDYQKRVLAGEKLKGTEAKILQYKNQIRIQDVKALYNAGAITKQDVQRLIVAKQITKEQAKQLIGQSANNARMSLFMGGLKKAGSGILSFFGGLPGIAIGAIAGIFAYWYSKNEAIKEQTTQMQDELSQRRRTVGENTPGLKRRAGEAKANDDIPALSETYEELKKQVEDISPVILARKLAEGDKATFTEAVDYMVKVNEELEKSLEYAEKMAYLFPKAAEDANGWFTEDIKSNIEDLEKEIRKYEKAKRNGWVLDTFVGKKNVRGSIDDDVLDEANNLAGQYRQMAREIKGAFGEEWTKNADAAWIDLENWMSEQGLSDEMKQFARLQFSDIWGDIDYTSIWPDIKKKLSEALKADSSDMGKEVSRKILGGEGLNDAEFEYAQKLVKNIAKGIADNPALSKELKKSILGTFSQGSVTAKIIAQVVSADGKPWKNFLKREIAALNNDPDNKLSLAVNQADSIAEFWETVQKAYDNAKEKLKKLKGIKLPIGVNFTGQKISIKDALQKAGVWTDWVNAKNGRGSFSREKVAKANEIITFINEINSLVDTVSLTEDFAKKENYELEANKKGKKNNGGSKKDAIAEAWKNRLAVMREYADEFDKLVARVGKDNAMLQMEERSKAMGWNAILPSGFNRKDPRKSIRNYYNKEVKDKAKTTEQKNVAKDYAKYLFNVDDSDAKDQIDKVLSGIQKQISDKQKKWSLYSKAKESTGDASVAVSLAFGSGADAENAVADYRKMLETYLKQNKIDISIDDLLGMSEEDILGNSKLGERYGKPIVAMTKAISDATAKEAERTVNNYLRILKESQDYDAKLKALAQQEQTDLLDLQSRGGTEEQQKALQDSYTEKRGKVLFEQFQKNSGWEKLFDDLGRVSNTSLDEFERQINKFATTAGLGVTETKALVNAIKKVREEQISRNPLKYIWEGITNTNTIKGFMQNATANADGSYNVDATQAAAMGISKTGIISKKEMQSMSDDRDKEIDDNFVKGLESASNALKSFENVLSPVADLFSAMGNDTMSDAVNIGSSALSSAASTASSFSSLSTIAEGAGLGEGTSKILGKVGAFGAAASAALSVTTGLFSLHDKAIQKEIDASKERQKEAANLFKNLKSALEEGYGGFYSSTNNYDEMLASLKAQRDEVAYQLAKEQSRGSKKDTGTISDLKQELKEAQDTIDQFAETMAKELYSVDFKSYSSTLADTLVSAWSEGKSAAESYGDAVNDILKNVATSVVKQKWIENLIEPLADDFMEQFEKNDGVVDENMMALLSQIYDLSEEATNATNSYMDAMEYIANQHGETLKNASTGTLANGIESITEDTADLLAGYINSIRADTSILRATNTEILKAVQGMSGMPVIARSQLEQLNVIAENTSRSAENAEMIYGILNKVTNGSLQFAIK